MSVSFPNIQYTSVSLPPLSEPTGGLLGPLEEVSDVEQGDNQTQSPSSLGNFTASLLMMLNRSALVTQLTLGNYSLTQKRASLETDRVETEVADNSSNRLLGAVTQRAFLRTRSRFVPVASKVRGSTRDKLFKIPITTKPTLRNNSNPPKPAALQLRRRSNSALPASKHRKKSKSSRN